MRSRGTTRGRRFAISILALSFALILGGVSFAGVQAGTVTHLNGPLFAKKADGSTWVLSVGSVVEEGDILVTEKETHARVRFVDGAEVVLRSRTRLKIAGYRFDQARPDRDSAVFNLLQGGVRSVVGLIGKRGNQGAYRLSTETATIGVRGTVYESRICAGDCGPLPDGVYFYVIEGAIEVTNAGGSQTFTAGQYAYVQDASTLPRLLPGDPGLDFTLPPELESSPANVDVRTMDRGCTVR